MFILKSLKLSKKELIGEWNVTVDVEFEKIPYTITINSGTGFTVDPTSPITVLHGEDKEIIITGYRLTSVKVNDVEQTLPLTNNKLTLTDITAGKTTVITVKEIEYEVTNGGEAIQHL